MRCAITEPVVERSTKRRTRLPSITPSGPVATLSTISGVGRLTITVSAMSAISFGERAATRAERGEIADRFLAGVVDDDLVAGLDQPPRHVRAHIAETDEADVHELSSPTYFALIVAAMNSARTFSVCSPSAGTGP